MKHDFDIRTTIGTKYGPTPQQWSAANKEWSEEKVDITDWLRARRCLVPGDLSHTELHLEIPAGLAIAEDVIDPEDAQKLRDFLTAYLNEEFPNSF